MKNLTNKTSLSFILIPLISAFILSGCLVPKSNLVKQKQETDTCYEALQKENDQKEELTVAVAELQEVVTQLAAQRMQLTSEKSDLTEQQNAMQNSMGDLEKEIQAKLSQITRITAEKTKIEAEKAKLEAKTETYDDLVKGLHKEMKSKLIEIKRKGKRITVGVSDKVLFDSGSSELKDSGKEALAKIADILKTVKDRRIDVEGHTDNLPITGELTEKFPTNWELSASRAVNVVRFMAEAGVNPKNLSGVAKSKYQPRASNKNRRGRTRNRRIEIVLTPKNK